MKKWLTAASLVLATLGMLTCLSSTASGEDADPKHHDRMILGFYPNYDGKILGFTNPDVAQEHLLTVEANLGGRKIADSGYSPFDGFSSINPPEEMLWDALTGRPTQWTWNYNFIAHNGQCIKYYNIESFHDQIADMASVVAALVQPKNLPLRLTLLDMLKEHRVAEVLAILKPLGKKLADESWRSMHNPNRQERREVREDEDVTAATVIIRFLPGMDASIHGCPYDSTDPKVAGPRYQHLEQYVYSVFKPIASNAWFMFAPNIHAFTDNRGNSVDTWKLFYPGDEYVDWMGTVVYIQALVDVDLDAYPLWVTAYKTMAQKGKKIGIAEFGGTGPDPQMTRKTDYGCSGETNMYLAPGLYVTRSLISERKEFPLLGAVTDFDDVYYDSHGGCHNAVVRSPHWWKVWNDLYDVWGIPIS